jgi:hypothetical protein
MPPTRLRHPRAPPPSRGTASARPATPMLVLPDDTPAHPYAVAMDIAALAPNAEATVYPWREPPELLARTIEEVRAFLRAHQPLRAAAAQ